jgi:hypothetical protein
MGEDNLKMAGLIVIAAVCILIGASVFPSLGNDVGVMTGTQAVTNKVFSIGANGVTVDLIGQELLSTPVVTNKTDGVTIGATNYTIAEGVSSSTGYKTIQYKTVGTAFASRDVNITYTYGAAGYIDNAGGRAMIPLIFVFFAILLLVIALTPALRSGIMDMWDRVRN